MSVSWGTMYKGAKIAAAVITGAVVAKAMFSNPAEAVDPREAKMDQETFAMKIENQRMQALMDARMQAVGMAEGMGGRGA
jgi:hypothetical protein